MAIHMSIRLAWHSDGWNGHICKRPCENSYCIGQHSYPGDLIASTRDLEFEAAHAGESCSALPCKAACGLSVNAFGKDTITVRVDPPSFWKKNDADAINITLPPSTVCTWCYEAMYNDEVEARGATAQKYDYAKRKEGAENYFAQFEPGKSLIFYYAGYSNPFSENEEDNYVIVGVSRVSKIGDTFYYDNTSDEVKRKYAGGFVWQKPVTSTYPDEGFCIPYWKYMDDEEILNRIVIKPQNRGPFKYGSREVYNDDAIEVVNQLIAVVDTLIEIGDDTEDWNKRKAWLNSVLNELWTARGPYPGFPSILESLGLHTFVSSYIGLTFDDEMKEYRIAVREFLEGNRDDVQGMTLSKSDMKKIRREYQLLDDDTADFMFEILSRFDLRADQVCSIVSEDRENVSITASIAEMKENPYIIFEQYIGYDSDDVIPFYRIDNGVIPSPEYGIDEILDCGSTERLRAFCVDELNRIAAHSFGKAKSILKTINARVERLPEWKRYVYRMKNFDIDQEIWEGALVQKKDDQGILYLYLKENYEDERTIEDALRNLADRPDITLKMAITPEKFKRGLRVEGSPLEKKTAAEYDLILEHQAEICMQIFVKPLCVLSGAAGTGKTTVIRTILDNIERVHGAGTSFLLMAPTGKAAERIKTQTGKPSSTIHSYLAKNGWINENFTLKRIGGRDSQDINTIIIDECYDKVIQFRNRPQSDPAYAYVNASRNNTKAEIFNGEIGLTIIHGLDRYAPPGKQPKYKWQGNIDRFQVVFSGESRRGLRYNYGKKLGQDKDGKWIPEQKVLDNLELAYAISVHKSQGSEFDYVYIVVPHKESHLLSMELLYTAITRAQKKVTIFLQQDISTLTTLSRAEKSAVRKINSSVFKFEPLPDDLLYAGSNWYESGKKIATLSQYFVRSKSEAIITNLLVDRNIPFKYEEPLYAPDGTMYLPDFTVKFRGEEYYWEHVGRINDTNYMAHWAKKEAWYKKHFPGKLLVTYESNELTTDAAAIIARNM